MQWSAGLWASVFGSSPNTCAHHACNWCMVVFGTSRAAFKRLCNWWGSKVHATPRLNCPHNHTWGWFWPVHPMHVCSAHCDTWWPLSVHAMPFPTLDLTPRLIGQIWKCHWASKAEWWKNAGQCICAMLWGWRPFWAALCAAPLQHPSGWGPMAVCGMPVVVAPHARSAI